MEYTLDYFIKKFEAIPEEGWCTRTYTLDETHCAIGWCDDLGRSTPETEELRRLFYFCLGGATVATLNDGDDMDYQQPTPKQRILAALYDIKANDAVKEVQEIVNHPVSVLV